MSSIVKPYTSKRQPGSPSGSAGGGADGAGSGGVVSVGAGGVEVVGDDGVVADSFGTVSVGGGCGCGGAQFGSG